MLIKRDHLLINCSLKCILQVSIWVDTLSESLFLVVLAINFLITTAYKLIILSGSQLTRSDISCVLPESLSAHGAIENLNWLEAKPWPDLNKSQLLNVILLSELFLMLVYHLVDAEPDTIIVVVERENMINEGL